MKDYFFTILQNVLCSDISVVYEFECYVDRNLSGNTTETLLLPNSKFYPNHSVLRGEIC